MGGAVEAIADVGGDIISSAADVSSVVTDLGAEFITPEALGIAGAAFGVPGPEVFSTFGGFNLVGSFAGDAAWFDAFNPGAILDSVPSVGDFSLGSVTDSLPSISSIKDSAMTVVSDFRTVTSTVQSGLKVVNQAQAVAGQLGVQLPGASIVRAVNQGAGLVNSATAGLSSVTATAGSLTAKATSLFAPNPTAANAINVATGLPINTPREVDANGLSILTAQETTALTKNATLISSLVDPEAPIVDTYSEAVASEANLLASKQEYETAIAGYEREIANSNKNIEEMQANLQDPNLSDRQRAILEAQIKANQETIAVNTDNLLSSQSTLDEINTNLENNQAIITSTNTATTSAPGSVNGSSVAGGNTNRYAVIQETNGTFSIIDSTTGDTIQSGLSETAATAAVENLNITNDAISVNRGSALDNGTDPYVSNGQSTIPQINPTTTQQAALQEAGTNIQNLVAQARQQQEIRNQRQDKAQSTDWRVRLRLAPNSNYLYNSNDPGILAPLASSTGTDGVIFPYTPSIDTAYKANYDAYDLTHSNYRGYFYKNSYVDVVNVRAQFTAQDTNEANYLLAVIHFFRSATKMFYGQDSLRGSPPPLVYLSGYGVNQFNEHPCLIGQFNYTLPPDVDYIRAGAALDNGTNFLANRTRQPNPNNPLSYSINRLLNNGLVQGALDIRPSVVNNLNVKSPSYVPTKMEISITLLPIQSRSQVSKQFSLQGFSNGNLLRAGYW